MVAGVISLVTLPNSTKCGVFILMLLTRKLLRTRTNVRVSHGLVITRCSSLATRNVFVVL
jgi:hypothetical protein